MSPVLSSPLLPSNDCREISRLSRDGLLDVEGIRLLEGSDERFYALLRYVPMRLLATAQDDFDFQLVAVFKELDGLFTAGILLVLPPLLRKNGFLRLHL